MAKIKDSRKKTPRITEIAVLDKSRRRCALCFYLKNDLSEKHGQLAHLDGNPANFKEDNLAFLCMEHHTLFDSKTSQHKNYTVDEVKTARDRLYQAIVEDRHVVAPQPDSRSLGMVQELDVIRSEILHTRINNDLYPALNKLRKFFIVHPELFKIDVNSAFYQKWLDDPTVEMGIPLSSSKWTLQTRTDLATDLEEIHC